MRNLIYLEIYNIKTNNGIENILERFKYYYKYLFKVISKKENKNFTIWTLPILENLSINKTKRIMLQLTKYKDNIYILEEKIKNKKFYKLMDELEIKYCSNNDVKKMLLEKTLNYISKIQKKSLKEYDITFLINENNQFESNIIEEIAKKTKSIKIVTPNICKFKKLEETLYKNEGIPIQFSNSYKKSLLNAKIIVNFDFNKTEMNEYYINNRAIIINCLEEKISIKDKKFNGVLINSYKIEFENKIRNILKQSELINRYDNLDLLNGILLNTKKIELINRVKILGVIGNNNVIEIKEIINLNKII